MTCIIYTLFLSDIAINIQQQAPHYKTKKSNKLAGLNSKNITYNTFKINKSNIHFIGNWDNCNFNIFGTQTSIFISSPIRFKLSSFLSRDRHFLETIHFRLRDISYKINFNECFFHSIMSVMMGSMFRWNRSLFTVIS